MESMVRICRLRAGFGLPRLRDLGFGRGRLADFLVLAPLVVRPAPSFGDVTGLFVAAICFALACAGLDRLRRGGGADGAAMLAAGIGTAFVLFGPALVVPLALVGIAEILVGERPRPSEAMVALVLFAAFALRVDAGSLVLGAPRELAWVLFVAAAASFVVLAETRGEIVLGRAAGRFARIARDAATLVAAAGTLGAYLLWLARANGGVPGLWGLVGVLLLGLAGVWRLHALRPTALHEAWAVPWLLAFLLVTRLGLAEGGGGWPLP